MSELASRTAERLPVDYVSVICWDASFRENFDAVACALNQTLPEKRYEMIFLEYYEQVNPNVVALCKGRDNVRTVALGNPHPGRPNEHVIGACINEGLRRARGDLIVIPDADVLFERDFLEEVVRRHERIEELALCFYRVDEPATGHPVPREIEAIKRVGRIEFPRNYGGCLTVRKKWLEAVNGYEQDPLWRGYTSVGRDVAIRLKALGLCIQWHPEKLLYHGYHPGCHRPDKESMERIRIQRAIIAGREKALETLPTRGLDPNLRPGWTYDPSAGRPGSLKLALRRAVRALVPGPLRRALVRLLSD